MRVENPLTHLPSLRSTPTNREVFTSDLVKTWALSPKTCLGGIPRPTSPQHKQPLSHSVDAQIFARRPPNSTWAPHPCNTSA